MNHLLVVSFADDSATAVMRQLRGLERAGQIQLEDTAVIRRDASGKVHVSNEMSATTEAGAAVGALLGAVLWFLFPVVGIAIGAAAGALVGRLLDTGVDPAFVRNVKQKLTPGGSALFLVIRHASYDAVVGALEPFKGELIQTSLDSDVEEELREALR